MVWADSHRISRAPWYLGNKLSRTSNHMLTRLSLSMVARSRAFSLISYTTRSNHRSDVYPHFPCVATSGFLHNTSFWLFPFRSPLLRESLRFLFLALLRCFSSRRLPPYPMNSDRDTWSLSRWVAPFGYLRINAWLAAPRSFQQPPTSFFAS